MGLHNSLLRRIILPAGAALAGYQAVFPYLAGLEQSQWWPPAQLRELQNAKLRRLIAHVYEHVPFYRELMTARGLTPADFQTTDDLVKLPVVDKHVLTSNFPDAMRDHSLPRNSLIAASSSGSTGERLQYWTTKDQKAAKWAGLFRFWEMAGFRFGDRYATFTVSANRGLRDRPQLARLEWALMRHLWLPMVEITDDKLHNYARQLASFRPLVLRSYASTAYFLARYMVKSEINVPIPGIITTGETLTDHMRQTIELAFAPGRVFNEYGADGMQIAGECDQHQGLHINDETLFVEVLRNGQPAPPGELGELVLTNLQATAVPFIRYNIQDVGRLSYEPCPCGRGLSRLTHLEGRLTDLFATHDGRWLSVHHFTRVFGQMPSVKSFQVIQHAVDAVQVKLVVNDSFSDQDRQAILTAFHSYLGPAIRLNLDFVDEIPTTPSGKRRFFISEVIQGMGNTLAAAAAAATAAAAPGEECL